MAKKKSASRAEHEKSDVDFEKAMEEVEQIVTQLESGELGLTESLGQYEQGIKRLKQCHGLLDAAEQRVSVLSGFDADGNPVTESLDQAEGEKAREPNKTRSRRRPSPGNDAAHEQDRVDDSPGLF